ncbi:unnamed protein product, partial [Discosporangium mesarthrocarpum]
VPPYARAGLYKQLASLKDLLQEFREDPVTNAALRPLIVAQMEQAGLFEDMPYPKAGAGAGAEAEGGQGEERAGVLAAESAEALPVEGQVGGVRVRVGFGVMVNRYRHAREGAVSPLKMYQGKEPLEADVFVEYARSLSNYLQTLEQRLFSEGLHVLGGVPSPAETEQYLKACFGGSLPANVSE